MEILEGPSPMKTHYHRYLELFILVLILYSISMHVAEVEITQTEDSSAFFLWSERVVGALFTIEYLARWVASRSIFYPLRIMAIIDLVSILPFYLSFMVDLRSFRMIRVLRILRMFKLYRYTSAMEHIGNAFYRIRYEFGIIGFAVLTLGWIGAVAIHELEHVAQPEAFAKLSDAAWFVLATITTVGYGDKVPITPGGRIATALVMIGGLGLFGTFVSLIGSAFVEELRNARLTGAQAGSEPQSGGPIVEMTLGSFDAYIVLQQIQGNSPNAGNGIPHDEALRLLSVACQRLLEKDNLPN